MKHQRFEEPPGTVSCRGTAPSSALPLIPHSRPELAVEDLHAVTQVLTSGMLARGDLTATFEAAVANYVDLPFGVSTSSGTAALALALSAVGAAAGTEVIIPTYVCSSVLNAVRAVGAEPVLVDVGDDWLIDLQLAKARVWESTAAIVVPYVFGIAKDVRPLVDIGLPVIEDCCQSMGATLNGEPVGRRGAVSCFSFHATKCLTTGEGGMCCTSEAEIATRMRELRDTPQEASPSLGSAFSDLQAALGLAQLRRYDDFLLRRRMIADRYYAALEHSRFSAPLHVRGRSMHFRLPVSTRSTFADVREHFERRGIAVRRGVDELLHRTLGLSDDQFPVATRLFETTVSIPIYPALTDDHQERVIAALQEYVG